MSFQGALRVMQCQICVTDLGERWWRQLCVGRERLRADSNSQYKNSSRQEGRKEGALLGLPTPKDSHTATSHEVARAEAHLHKRGHILFVYSKMECTPNIYGQGVTHIFNKLNGNRHLANSNRDDAWPTHRRWFTAMSWDSTLFLMSCLPLLGGWIKESLFCRA